MHRGPERRGWRGKSATRTICQGSSSVDGKVNIAHAMVDRPDGRCAGQGEPHPWGTRTFGTPLSTLASNCRSFRNRIDAKLERQRPGMSCRNMVRRFESGGPDDAHRAHTWHAVGIAVALMLGAVGCGTTDELAAAKPSSSPVPCYLSSTCPQTTSGPSSSPIYSPTPTPTGPNQIDFGSPATATSGSATASITVTAPTFATRDPGFSTAEYGNPKNGVYAIFSVSAVGVSGTSPISESSFCVRGTDGTRYQVKSTIGFGSDLNSANLGPQEPIIGNVVFDLPTRTGTLLYAPGLSALGEWKF